MISNEYAAGFFDGEGCVSISKCKPGKPTRNIRYELFVQVPGTNPAPMKLMKERWGGSLKPYKQKNPKHKIGWRWLLSAKMATRFLLDVLPHLVIKRPVAEVGLALSESHRLEKVCRNRPMTQGVLDYREGLYIKTRKLNKRGIGDNLAEMSEVSL